MAPGTGFVSVLPSDMVQGGLIDDIDVTIEAARWEQFDYQGKADKPALALKLELRDDDGQLHEHYCSAGDPKFFVPSDDGQHVLPTGEKGALHKGSNYEAFMVSLINAGYPVPQLEKAMGPNGPGVGAALNGLKIHVKRQAAPKRGGIINAPRPGPDGQVRENTQLIVTAILQLPGEKKAGAKTGAGTAGTKTSAAAASGKTNGAAKASTAAPAAPASSGDEGSVDDKLVPLVQQALAESNGAINIKALVPFVFKTYKGADKRDLTRRVAEAAFHEWAMGETHWLFDEASGDLQSA